MYVEYTFDIDSGIFIGFLLATIILGFASSRGIRNIKEYAVANRNFSTANYCGYIGSYLDWR